MRHVVALFMALCCSSGQGYGADTLDCPEISSGSVLDFISNASGDTLFMTQNRVDLANEISEPINRPQIAKPNISWSDVQNVLVAAYCRVVARKPGLTAAKNWSRMRLRQHPGTADRGEHNAGGNADPWQCSSSSRRLSRAQEAGRCVQTDDVRINDSHPDTCGRKIAVRQTITASRSSSLTLQLGDVDVDAALLGDRLDRSREIGVAQQVMVAHPANGCHGGLRQIEDEHHRVQQKRCDEDDLGLV